MTTTGPRPYAEEWLQFEQLTGGRFNLTGDIPTIRAQFLGLFNNMKGLLPPPMDAVTITEVTVPDTELSLRIYSPTRKSEQLLPIGLYLHSGGWVSGGANYEDHLCRYYVEHTPTVSISPEYRLAPEYKFPAGLNDCFEAYQWMIKNASTYGADASLAYTIESSAGGNLALAVTLKIITTPGLTPPKAEFEDSAFLDRKCMDTCEAAYGASPAEPLFSVLLHPELARLPPIYLVVYDKDPTHDEIIMLNAEMQEKGCKVELKEYRGYPHFFFIVPMLKASQEYLDDIVKQIQKLVVS